MLTIKKVTLLIPCYNEEEGVGKVIDSAPYQRLQDLGFELSIIVIDNNSQDKTSEVAKSRGVPVILETQQGKGNALITGFRNLPQDTDYVAMIDGDDTYDLKELPRLLEPLESGFADVIIGTRLNGRMDSGSMKGFNRLGNWLFTFLARLAYRTNTTDVCSGFFVWKKQVIDQLWPHLSSKAFSIEMEMIVKMAKLDFQVFSVPISYQDREGQTSLHPVKDGIIILKEWARHLTWNPSKSTPQPSTYKDAQDF